MKDDRIDCWPDGLFDVIIFGNKEVLDGFG